MTQSQIVVPSRRIAARVVDGQALILDPETDALQRLNEVGSFIWARIAERCHTVAAIQASIVEEFEVDPQQAASDLSFFLDKLVERDLITYTPD